jgi:hypothetical protein
VTVFGNEVVRSTWLALLRAFAPVFAEYKRPATNRCFFCRDEAPMRLVVLG